MHEMSLTASLLDMVDEQAAEHGFKTVNSLRLSYGKLSCVDARAVQFAFDVLSEDRIACGARLEFDILPVILYCFSCEKEVTCEGYQDTCPECGSPEVMILSGTEELRFVEMSVD